MRIIRPLANLQATVPVWGGGSSSEKIWTGLQWWPPDVTSTGEAGKFPCLMSGGGGGGAGLGGDCTVRSSVSWIIVTWDSPPLWTHTRVFCVCAQTITSGGSKGVPNSFNFMKFLRKFGKKSCWQLGEILDPPLIRVSAIFYVCGWVPELFFLVKHRHVQKKTSQRSVNTLLFLYLVLFTGCLPGRGRWGTSAATATLRRVQLQIRARWRQGVVSSLLHLRQSTR